MNRAWSPSWAISRASMLPALEPSEIEGQNDDTRQRVKSRATKRDKENAQSVRHVRTVTLSFRNIHEYGELYPRYLEARKSIFIDRLGWTVSEADGMEFDQYDTPHCRYVILHEFGEVLGAVRLIPSTASCGIYSYMLRDAQQGVLPDLPPDVLFIEAPVEHGVWEATRFFITDAVPAKYRLGVRHVLFRKMIEAGIANGANHILGIVPDVWMRWSRPLGVTATPIGAKFSINGTKSQAVLFNTRDYEC